MSDGDGEHDGHSRTTRAHSAALAAAAAMLLGSFAASPAAFAKPPGYTPFEPADFYSSGQEHPLAIASGHFNADNEADIALALNDGSHPNRDVAIAINKGKGKFKDLKFADAGFYMSELAVADFNEDGLDDVVAVGSFETEASVLLNRGQGELGEDLEIGQLFEPQALAAGDVDSDTHADVVIGQEEFSDRSLAVFNGNGEGGFDPQTAVPLGQGSSRDLAITDLNLDGFNDVAIGGFDDIATVLANDSGEFEPFDLWPGLPWAEAVTAIDLDEDGDQDVLTVGPEERTVGVHLGNGDGTLAPLRLEGDMAGEDIEPGDFNLDGDVDVAIADSFRPALLLGNGDGTLGRRVRYRAGGLPARIAVGDLNRDDADDFAVVNDGGEGFSVLLNDIRNPQIRTSGLADASSTNGKVSNRSGCATAQPTARIRIKDKSPLRRAKILLDGKKLDSTRKKRVRLRLPVSHGKHKLKVLAQDRARNRGRRTKTFRIC